MNFWASSESFRPAGEGLERTRRAVEAYLDSAFGRSSLAVIDADHCATPEQIEEFKRILEEAVPRILVEQPERTRH